MAKSLSLLAVDSVGTHPGIICVSAGRNVGSSLGYVMGSQCGHVAYSRAGVDFDFNFWFKSDHLPLSWLFDFPLTEVTEVAKRTQSHACSIPKCFYIGKLQCDDTGASISSATISLARTSTACRGLELSTAASTTSVHIATNSVALR